MVQELCVRLGNEKRRVAWVSISVSVIFVSIPPLALLGLSKHVPGREYEGFFMSLLDKSGITFTGLFLFPFLAIGSLILALFGLRTTVARSSRLILWLLFILSMCNCALVLDYFSTHINK
jgi:hypothetical protein